MTRDWHPLMDDLCGHRRHWTREINLLRAVIGGIAGWWSRRRRWQGRMGRVVLTNTD